MEDLIPAFAFDTSGLDHAGKLAAWARLLPWFEVGRLDQVGDFDVHAQAWLLDGAVVSVTRMPPVWLARSAARIAGDGRSDYAIIVGSAPWRMTIDRASDRLIDADQVVILDNSQPFGVKAAPGEYTILNLPRAMLVSERLQPAPHGVVLTHALSLVFGDFLRGLRRRLPGLTVGQAPALAAALRDLLLACAAGGAAAARARASDASPLQRAGWYVDVNLASALKVDDVASALGVSRSTLYRIFAEVGGVERFVLKRRLARARVILASDSVRRPRVREVALATGFASTTHFTRAFKAEYGVTPTAIRASPQEAPSDAAAAARFRSWFDAPPAGD